MRFGHRLASGWPVATMAFCTADPASRRSQTRCIRCCGEYQGLIAPSNRSVPAHGQKHRSQSAFRLSAAAPDDDRASLMKERLYGLIAIFRLASPRTIEEDATSQAPCGLGRTRSLPCVKATYSSPRSPSLKGVPEGFQKATQKEKYRCAGPSHRPGIVRGHIRWCSHLSPQGA